MTDESCGVLVVGAGPAGLFAGLGLSDRGVNDVIIADAGKPLHLRSRDPAQSSHDDLVLGEGGAGLFSDGKLCLSLQVGGDLPSILDTADQQRLLATVASVFGAPVPNDFPPKTPHDELGMGAFGIERTVYPVAHLGSDHCAERIAMISSCLRRARKLRMGHRLVELERCVSGGFVATFETQTSPRRISADRVVLALGKAGARRQSAVCEALGACTSDVPMYIGVRVEAEDSDAEPLFHQSPDPKFKLFFEDGTKCKTHCGAAGGEVLPVFYDGLPVAAGHAYAARASGRTSFAVLWDGVAQRRRGVDMAYQIMQSSSSLTGGRLLVQRLQDYWALRSSAAREVAMARPTPSLWAPGNMRDIFSSSFFDHFDALMERLLVIAPRLDSPRTLMYGPAIEWWMRKVSADHQLQTQVPGLFVAGDGAGWSQGIVHAAATGLLVAEAISGESLNTGRLTPLQWQTQAQTG